MHNITIWKTPDLKNSAVTYFCDGVPRQINVSSHLVPLLWPQIRSPSFRSASAWDDPLPCDRLDYQPGRPCWGRWPLDGKDSLKWYIKIVYTLSYYVDLKTEYFGISHHHTAPIHPSFNLSGNLFSNLTRATPQQGPCEVEANLPGHPLSLHNINANG